MQLMCLLPVKRCGLFACLLSQGSVVGVVLQYRYAVSGEEALYRVPIPKVGQWISDQIELAGIGLPTLEANTNRPEDLFVLSIEHESVVWCWLTGVSWAGRMLLREGIQQYSSVFRGKSFREFGNNPGVKLTVCLNAIRVRCCVVIKIRDHLHRPFRQLAWRNLTGA